MAQEGAFRCSDCGHGRRLSAWAGANVYGRLDERGEVDWTDGEQFELYESSIQCDLHPNAPLERKVNGRWSRWVNCSASNCREGREAGYSHKRCESCDGNLGRWVPIRDLPTAEATRIGEA